MHTIEYEFAIGLVQLILVIMEDVYKVSIKNLLQETCTKENIINPKYEYCTDLPKNGFMGSIAKIEISGENEKTLHLIVKYASRDDDVREKLKIRDAFLHEIQLYKEVVPLFATLQERYGSKHPFDSTCKYFGSDDTSKCELILLEDLTKDGYSIKNSLVPMDGAHVEFVLKNYGKYHAVSLAYKHHDFEGYQKLINNVENLFKKYENNDVMKIFDNAFNNLKNILNPNDAIFQPFSKVCENVREIFNTVTTPNEYAVIYHGDSWCNNMMFKYENQSSVPTSMMFIDFQGISPGSVAMDVSYFFMANSSPDMIKNADHYLKVYYDSLADHLRDLNCDPDVIFPYSTFQEQWKQYSLYGLLLSITALKFALAGADEKPDLAKDFTDAVNFVGKHADEYQKRTEAIITYYYEAGII